MDPSTDQLKDEAQDVSSDPQELSSSVAQTDEPSAVSCDTNETNPDSSLVDPFDNTDTPQPTDQPSKSEPLQTADERQVAHQLKYGPYSDRYFPHHQSYRLSRDILREIAVATLDALDDGFYFPPAPKVVDRTEAEQTEEKKIETDEIKEEEKEEGGDGESKREDEQPETRDGTDEKVHSHADGMEVNIVEHRKAGREPYDLKTKIWHTNGHTRFIAPDDEASSLWSQAELPVLESGKKTRIIIAEYSTLVGARRLQELTKDEAEPERKIAVLNFASAKKPGGGFLNGSQAQEESLARSSTLYASLLTPPAKQFYRLYSADPDNAFYSHAMVYSPSVILLRDDKGDWTAPIEVDILTSAAVNAGDVRKQVRWEEEMRALRDRVRVAELARRRELSLPTYLPTHVRIYESEPQRDETTESGQQSLAHSEQPSTSSVQVSPIIFASDPPSPPMEPISLPPPTQLTSPLSQLLGATASSQLHSPSSPYPHPPNVDPLTHAENLIAATMHERIARILYLFQLQGAKHLVLGSFGTGVFQNSVGLVAGIFRDLLCDPENEDEGKAKEKKKEGDQEGDQDDEGVVEGDAPPIVSGVDPKYKGKFKDVFDTVMFAILGGSTVKEFRDVFEGVEGLELDEEADGSDVEGMKDPADFHAQVRDKCDPPA